MLVAVLVLFVVTWLPNLLMDILYYTKLGNFQKIIYKNHFKKSIYTVRIGVKTTCTSHI